MKRRFEVREAKTKRLVGETDEKGLQFFLDMITDDKYYGQDGIPGDRLGFPRKYVFVGDEVLNNRSNR